MLPLRNGQRLLKVCQCHEILPNLVTLHDILTEHETVEKQLEEYPWEKISSVIKESLTLGR